MQKYTQNYLHAGGQRSFSEYYTARYDFAILRPTLQRNIVFSQHNLVSATRRSTSSTSSCAAT